MTTDDFAIILLAVSSVILALGFLLIQIALRRRERAQEEARHEGQ